MKRGWWYSASTEDRLAQIDGAIELGMTAKQCAMNCGCMYDSGVTKPGDRISGFARSHGRHFKGDSVGTADKGFTSRNGRLVQKKSARIEDAKQAYLSGEPVDMWSVE